MRTPKETFLSIIQNKIVQFCAVVVAIVGLSTTLVEIRTFEFKNQLEKCNKGIEGITASKLGGEFIAQELLFLRHYIKYSIAVGNYYQRQNDEIQKESMHNAQHALVEFVKTYKSNQLTEQGYNPSTSKYQLEMSSDKIKFGNNSDSEYFLPIEIVTCILASKGK